VKQQGTSETCEEKKEKEKKGNSRGKIKRTNSLKTKLTFQAQLQAINIGCKK